MLILCWRFKLFRILSECECEYVLLAFFSFFHSVLRVTHFFPALVLFAGAITNTGVESDNTPHFERFNLTLNGQDYSPPANSPQFQFYDPPRVFAIAPRYLIHLLRFVYSFLRVLIYLSVPDL